jgi:hypothetical protein
MTITITAGRRTLTLVQDVALNRGGQGPENVSLTCVDETDIVSQPKSGRSGKEVLDMELAIEKLG